MVVLSGGLTGMPALAQGGFIGQIDENDEATKRARAQNGDLDGELDDGATGNAVDPRYGPGGEQSGCPGAPPGGRMSLLGVPSDMGPERRPGTRAVLDPRHPLWEEKKKQDDELAATDERLRAEAKAAGCEVPAFDTGAEDSPDWQERIGSAERWIEESTVNQRDRANDVQNRQELLRTVASADARAGVQRDLDIDLQKLAAADRRLTEAQQKLSCLQLQQAKYEAAMGPLRMARAATQKLIDERQQPCP